MSDKLVVQNNTFFFIYFHLVILFPPSLSRLCESTEAEVQVQNGRASQFGIKQLINDLVLVWTDSAGRRDSQYTHQFRESATYFMLF